MSTPREDLPGLTGARGIAASWVVLHHTFYAVASRWIHAGYIAVDLFFVLSGFVLAHVYLSEIHTWGARDYLRFLRARLARIYPLHASVLLALVVLVLAVPELPTRYPAGHEKFSADSLLGCLLLLQSWFRWPPMSWNPPSWSLSAEWFFYLVFPIVALVASKITRASRAIGGAILVLIGLIVVLRLKGIAGIDALGTPALVRAAAEATAGVLMYRASKLWPSRPHRAIDVVSSALIVVSIVFAELEVLCVFGFAGLVLNLSDARAASTRLMSRRVPVFLGQISFSLYLTHWVFLQLYNWAATGADPGLDLAGRLAFLLVAIAIATVTYRLIERPARKWLRPR